jgi:hypothetical protein
MKDTRKHKGYRGDKRIRRDNPHGILSPYKQKDIA